MSEVATTVEPGWRPDPSGRFEWRYWDGGWTNRVANSVPPAPATPTTATIPAIPAVDPAPPVVAVTEAPVREPFGADVPAGSPAPQAPSKPATRRRTPWAWFAAFVRSFADQPESYRSPNTPPELPAEARGEHVVAAPGNYGAAGLVALAACGIAGGAYLPWLSGVLNGVAYSHQTGVDLGHFWGYALGAAALALSALLSVQMRKLRWVTMGLALVLAGFVVHDLLDSYDRMQHLNLAPANAVNLGMGLMIMVVSAAIAMTAAVRLAEGEKIV